MYIYMRPWDCLGVVPQVLSTLCLKQFLIDLKRVFLGLKVCLVPWLSFLFFFFLTFHFLFSFRRLDKAPTL